MPVGEPQAERDAREPQHGQRREPFSEQKRTTTNAT